MMRLLIRFIIAVFAIVILLICVAAIKFLTLGKKVDSHILAPYVLKGIPNKDSSNIRLTFLGTSSFIFENEKDAILIDPFFSNPSLFSPDRKHNWADFVSPQTLKKLSIIAITHGHYDHCYDLPTLLPFCNDNIKIVGDKGVINQLYPLAKNYRHIGLESKSSTWIYSKDSSYRIKAFPTNHLPHLGTLEFLSGTYLQPLSKIPSALYHWKKCACYNYMIDILVRHTPVKRCVLIGGIMDESVMQAMTEEHNKFPISMLMHIMWKHSINTTYIEDMAGKWQPDEVLLFHWNNFFRPLDRPLQYFRSSQLPETLELLRNDNVPATVMLPFSSVHIK